MKAPVLVNISDVAKGDLLIAVDEGMWHTREVHEVTKGGRVTLASGERMKMTGQALVVREIDVSEIVDLTDEIDDPRDRPDLREAESARDRCARYDLDEGDWLYWDVYHRGPDWRENLTARGHELHEKDER